MNEKPSIFYIFLSRKWWMSVISMLVAIGALSFSDAEQAEMVSAIVGGIGAVYTIAVALEDGLRARNTGNTTLSTPSDNVTVSVSDTPPPPRVDRTGLM